MTKVQVAILGGGMGGLAAAYELTRANRGVELDITVFEESSYLGGKGASLRSTPDLRILEHGLHVWLGFYRQAFGMLGEVYGALGEDIAEAFTPARLVGFGPVSELLTTRPPPRAGTPWDGVSTAALSPRNLVSLAIDYVKAAASDTPELAFAYATRGELEQDVALSPPELQLGVADILAASAQARLILDSDERGDFDDRSIVDTFYALAKALRAARDRLAGISARLVWTLLDLLAAVCLAIQDNGLAKLGAEWTALDGEDVDDLLARYGAAQATRDSPIIKGYHDLVFSRPIRAGGAGIAAGTALRGLLSMVAGYRGHPVYKMVGGMGEVVFTRLYRYLHDLKGVRFMWRHRVTKIALSDDGRRVTSFSVQAPQNARAGEPLAKGTNRAGRAIEYWRGPARDDGAAAAVPEEPRVVTGFDEIILAIPLPALDGIADELVAKHPRFAAAKKNLRHTATRSVQAWWRRPIVDFAPWGAAAILCAMPEPYTAWADMSHLIEEENLEYAQGITYHCGDLANEAADEPAQFSAWLAAQLPGVAAPDRCTFRHNTSPTERYILSAAGTTANRLDPTFLEVRNLWLAGDWTLTSLPAGCIESATESGVLAARGLLNARVSLDRHSAVAQLRGGVEPAPAPPPTLPGGPYRLDGARVQGLFFPADASRLEEIVARRLPVMGDVAVWVPRPAHVALTVVDIAEMGSLDPRYPEVTSERDVAFWIPVVLLHPTWRKLTFFAPYLWVDDPLAIAIGRETYGFNKIAAQLEIGWSAGGELERAAVATAQPDDRRRMTVQPLLSIEPAGDEAFRGGDDSLVDRFLNALGVKPPAWLLARERRDAGAPWSSAREVLSLTPGGPLRLPKVRPMRYRVTFAKSRLYDLAGELGLTTALVSSWGFTDTLDMRLGDAEILFRE